MKVFKSKKGVEMTLSTIIIAILVLVVLVVLTMILTGKMKQFGEGTKEVEGTIDVDNCELPGYRTCVKPLECEEEQTEFTPTCGGGTVCCLLSDTV
jgi:ABC-type lipoprotein release transport system permease subunit